MDIYDAVFAAFLVLGVICLVWWTVAATRPER